METAIPTQHPASVYKKLQPESVTSTSDKRDIDLYEMAGTEGWKQLKEVIEGYIASLDRGMMIDPQDTVEALGVKFIATSLVKEYLRKILEIVSSSYDVIRERNENNITD